MDFFLESKYDLKKITKLISTLYRNCDWHLKAACKATGVFLISVQPELYTC